MHTPEPDTMALGQLASQANGNYGTGISAQALKSGAPFGGGAPLVRKIAMAAARALSHASKLFACDSEEKRVPGPGIPLRKRWPFTAVALAFCDAAVDLTARGRCLPTSYSLLRPPSAGPWR